MKRNRNVTPTKTSRTGGKITTSTTPTDTTTIVRNKKSRNNNQRDDTLSLSQSPPPPKVPTATEATTKTTIINITKSQQKIQVPTLLPVLCTTEFAAILNGTNVRDQPRIIQNTLQRFIKVIRYERKIALLCNDPKKNNQTDTPNNHNDNNNDKVGTTHDDDDLSSVESSEDENDSDNDDDEEEEDVRDDDKKMKKSLQKQKNKKKQQLLVNGSEKWKADTADYQVPFVGTSIRTTTTMNPNESSSSNNNSTASLYWSDPTRHVQIGVWPTGLLHQYLLKSPLAIEITSSFQLVSQQLLVKTTTDTTTKPNNNNNNNNNNNKKLQISTTTKKNSIQQMKRLRQIYKLYVKVLIELISAAIPTCGNINHQQQQLAPSPPVPVTLHDYRFMNILLIQRLPEIVQFIIQETNDGKGIAKQRRPTSISNENDPKKNQYNNYHRNIQKNHDNECGDLVPVLLQFIKSLLQVTVVMASSSTSITRKQTSTMTTNLRQSPYELMSNSFRYVVRLLQTTFSDDVIRFIVRYYSPAVAEEEEEQQQQQQQQQHKDEYHLKDHPRQISRIRFMEVVCMILEHSSQNHNDSNFLTILCTNGSKERNIHSGFLNQILKDGIQFKTVIVLSNTNTQQQQQTQKLKDQQQNERTPSFVQVCQQQQQPKELLLVMSRILRLTRSLLFMDHHDTSSQQQQQQQQRRRSLLELFNKDVMMSLCQLIQYAPTTTTTTLYNDGDDGDDNNVRKSGPSTEDFIPFESILNGTDEVQYITTTNEHKNHKNLYQMKLVHQVGIEARRLVYSLIADKKKSPLLYYSIQKRQKNEDSITEYNNSTTPTTMNTNHQSEYILVRIMICMIENQHGIRTNVEVQRFIVHIVTLTPSLLPALFRLLMIPYDFHDPKKVYSYITRLHFMNQLIRYGPSVDECVTGTSSSIRIMSSSNETPTPTLQPLPDTKNPDSEQQIGRLGTEQLPSFSNTASTEMILLSIVPRSFKKNIIVRAMSHPNTNHLVVMETMKSIIFILKRCKQYIVDQYEQQQKNHDRQAFEQQLYSLLLTTTIPDLNTLYNNLSRFDVSSSENATKKKQNDKKGKIKSNMILYGLLCELIRTMFNVFPSVLTKEDKVKKYDWLRIIPFDSILFSCQAPRIIQRSILHTLKEILMHVQSIQNFNVTSFRNILTTMLKSNVTEVTSLLRNIAITVLQQLWLNHHKKGSTELQNVLQYEATCWIDFLTPPSLESFCEHVQESVTNVPMSIIAVAQSWKYGSLPNPIPTFQFSPLLVFAIEAINNKYKSTTTTSSTNNFGSIICKVATKVLLYTINPLPLASFISMTSSTNNSGTHHQLFSDLDMYAKSLVNFHSYSAEDKLKKLQQVMASYSGKTMSITSPINFENNNSVNEIYKLINVPHLVDGNKQEYNYVEIAKQLHHILVILADHPLRECCMELFQKIVPAALQQIKSDEEKRNFVGFCSIVRQLNVNNLCPIDFTLMTWSGLQDTTIYSRSVLLSSCICSITAEGEKQYWDWFVLYFVGPFLSVDELIFVLNTTLIGKEAMDFSDKRCVAVINLYLRSLLDKHSDMDYSKWEAHKLACILFKHYEGFLIQHYEPEANIVSFVTLLESILCDNLSRTNSIYLGELPNHDIMKNTLAIKCWLKLNSSQPSQQKCLVHHIVQSDIVRFAPFLLVAVSDEQNHDVDEVLMNQGLLDKAIFTALTCTAFSEQSNLHFLMNKIILRVERLIVADKYNSNHALDDTTAILARLCREHSFMGNIDFNLFLKVTSQLTEPHHFESFSKITRENTLYFLLRSVEGLQATSSDNKLRSMGSALFSLSLNEFTQSWKSYAKKKSDTTTTTIDLPKLYTFLNDLLETDLQYDSKFFVQSDGAIFFDVFIRSCLRYGLGRTDVSDVHLQTMCIRILRKVMKSLDDKLKGIMDAHTLSHQQLCVQVFEMVTTHSKFSTQILNKENQSVSLRINIASLLRQCLQIAVDAIPFDEETWNILLASFDAGLNALDVITREVLLLYSRNAPKNSPACFLDGWQWGTVERSNESESSWDWLVESIDLNRIHATIGRFPVDDAVLPDFNTITQTETEEEEMNNRYLTKDKRYSPGFVLPLILAALEYDAHTNQRERESVSASDVVVADDPNANESDNDSVDNIDSTKQTANRSTTGILFVQKLCEKGALALALSALCSNSTSIRQISFSILGLILAVMDSKDARSISNKKSWRERPQLEMVINATIRAIVIHRATTETNQVESEHPESFYNVPKISGYAAVFLAKSSLFVCQPTDPLYVTTNRYFLRGEADCGAFQDLFKLPAFIYLFCSSNVDSEQRRIERKYAIELVRDGFVDADSYKILVTSYVPDLLVTSLESGAYGFSTPVVGNHSNHCGKETVLVLRTLTKFLRTGGERVRQHQFDRMGLLSWLRSFLIGRPVTELLPTIQSRVAFVQLVTLAITNAGTELSKTDIVISTAGIAQAAMDLCIKTAVRPTSIGTDGIIMSHYSPLESSTQQLVHAVCELITALQSQLQQERLKTKVSDPCDEVQNLSLVSQPAIDGIRLETEYQFLQLLGCCDDEEHSSSVVLFRSTLHALCQLQQPSLNLDDQEKPWRQFTCRTNTIGHSVQYNLGTIILQLAIRWSTKQKPPQGTNFLRQESLADFRVSVLQRVSIVQRTVESVTDLTAMVIILLNWRQECCCTDHKVRQAWFKCFSGIMSQVNNTDDDATTVDVSSDDDLIPSPTLDLARRALQMEN